MSEDARSDHKKYKAIVHGYVKRLCADFPSDAKEDSLVILYKSFKKFVAQYPTSEDREKWLEEIARRDAEAREFAKKFMEDFNREWHYDPEKNTLWNEIDGEIIRTSYVTEKPSLLRRLLTFIGL
ncbi:MAG: hypothetical protein M0R80_01260 [Proteobacteria bacterium]|jgi:DNA topoisomerase IA|nr:hypothetical protein [Pseudomonadota bacterium]